MLRSVIAVSSILSVLVVACSGSDVPVGASGTSSQQLQKKKDGSATGDGSTCSWEGTTAYDTAAATNAGSGTAQSGTVGAPPAAPNGTPTTPVPTYVVGDDFKSIDGCNECSCTAQGIMCTLKACPAPPTPAPCPALARMCKDGSTGKQGPNCSQICPEDGTVIACTDDAKKCPDGSYVPRVAPSCDFAACPTGGGTICGAPSKVCPDGTVISPGPNCVYPSCPNGGTVCSADAKECPDGSYVSRTGPNCTFPACPGETTTCTNTECGPAPLVASKQCADGSIAGPVCQRSAAGTCGWIITSCP